MDTLAGKVLVAMPGIGDDRFLRSVILVCAHSSDYAMGLVLNKPIENLTLAQLFEQLGVEQDIQLPNASVLDGGPVGTDRGFVMHSGDYHCDGATVDVCEGICMTATKDVLKAMASGGAPARAVMSLGYSGWGPGQLEQELSENSWIISESDPEIIFDEDYDTKWTRFLQIIGIDPSALQSGGSA